MEIMAWCACWGAGVPVCRPYGGLWTKTAGGPVCRPYGVFTNGSTYRKRDRSGTCPLKRRGETQFRRKFFCLLFFQEK